MAHAPGATDPIILATTGILAHFDALRVVPEAQTRRAQSLGVLGNVHVQQRDLIIGERRLEEAHDDVAGDASSPRHVGITTHRRERDGGDPAESSLTGGRHGARVVHVAAEVGPVVDPAGDEVGSAREEVGAEERDVDAVDRRAVDGVDVLFDLRVSERTMQRDGVTLRALLCLGRDGDHIRDLGESGPKGGASGREHAVVIGDKNQRPRHERVLSRRAGSRTAPFPLAALERQCMVRVP